MVWTAKSQDVDLSLISKTLRAYTECSDELQQSVHDMLEIVHSEVADDDERAAAMVTIGEILFPQTHDGEYGTSLTDADENMGEHAPDGAAALREVEAEEATFAARLEQVMANKQMNQSDLAKRIGVSQPAISLMLKRQCRPQRRTLNKLAEALEVPVRDLWPE